MRRAADNRRLNTAATYTEWRTIAAEIDERDGAARRWKLQFESPHYDYVLVHERLKDLQKARHLNDWARSACVVTLILSLLPCGPRASSPLALSFLLLTRPSLTAAKRRPLLAHIITCTIGTNAHTSPTHRATYLFTRTPPRCHQP